MADESSSPAGKRFSEDLRRIREERDFSIDDVHADTRIAKTLIESFEEGRLYDHPTYNRVYLRSFVKAYAKAVEISEDAALSGLDAALDGTYQNALAEQYLPSFQTDAGGQSDDDRDERKSSTQESPSPDEPEDHTSSSDMPDPPTAGGPEGRGGIVGPPRAVGEDSDETNDSDGPDKTQVSRSTSDTEEEGKEEPSFSVEADADEESDGADWPPSEGAEDDDAAEDGEADGTPDQPDTEKDDDEEGDLPSWMKKDDGDADDDTKKERASRSPSSSPNEGAAYRDTGESGIVGEPTELGSGKQEDVLEGADEAAMSSPEDPSQRTRDRSSGWMFIGDGTNQNIYITGAGIAVVLVVLVGLGFAYFSSENTSQDVSSAAPSPDTSVAVSAQKTSAAAGQAPPAGVTLGETIHLGVVATENVSSIRIRRDDDLRRPYWIQEGEAEVYPFQEEATIERELSDVRLFIDGYPYPFSPEDTVGGLEITRADLEAFVDTLRGEPTPLPATPDTLPIGTPSQEP